MQWNLESSDSMLDNVLSKQKTVSFKGSNTCKTENSVKLLSCKVTSERMCRKKSKGAIKLHYVENCDSDSDEHSEQVFYTLGCFP